MTPAAVGLLMYVLGWAGRRRWERKARDRARFDKRALVAANLRLTATVEHLDRERDLLFVANQELQEFLAVIEVA